MTTYYLDSSAISKRYILETGTAWVQSLVQPSAGNLIVTARITMVELYSALARRRRDRTVSAIDYNSAVQAFTQHSATEYQFVELDLAVIALARDLLERHPLRAYDSVQLATAFLSNGTFRSKNLAQLVFVSADDRLNLAAKAEGLAVDNPHNHP